MKDNEKVFRNFIVEAVVCAVFYLCSFLASRGGAHMLSSLLLVLYALGVYICRFRTTGNLVDMKGLFALAWVGGQGIACLQLSNLQTDWSVWTWAAFFLAYIGFCLGYLRKKPVRSVWSWRKMTGRREGCWSVRAGWPLSPGSAS